MAQLKVYQRRFGNYLKGLRDAWDNDDPITHAQATGLLLAQYTIKPKHYVQAHMGTLISFIEREGPEGVDGIFLSLLSAAESFDEDAFERGQALIDLNGNSFGTAHQDKVGIFFVDLAQQGGRDFGNNFGSTTPMSKFQISSMSDDVRPKLFHNGGVLARTLDTPFGGIGGNIRPMGSIDSSVRTISDNSIANRLMDRDQQLMITENQCIAGFTAGGAIGGFVAGATSGIGAVPGFGVGATIGHIAGGFICGSKLEKEPVDGVNPPELPEDDPDAHPEGPVVPDDDNGSEDPNDGEEGSSIDDSDIGGSTNDSVDDNKIGMVKDADSTISCGVPEDEDGSSGANGGPTDPRWGNSRIYGANVYRTLQSLPSRMSAGRIRPPIVKIERLSSHLFAVSMTHTAQTATQPNRLDF